MACKATIRGQGGNGKPLSQHVASVAEGCFQLQHARTVQGRKVALVNGPQPPAASHVVF